MKILESVDNYFQKSYNYSEITERSFIYEVEEMDVSSV